MGSADQGIVEAILRARMHGRGPDSMQPHNSEWFGYKNYPDIFDAMDSGGSEGYMLDNTPDDTLHQFGKYAQYQGMPLAPDVPSARDLRNVGRGDPEMRRRFEQHFGTESLNRADQDVPQNDKNYVPTPRPRPGEAPVGPSSDEYEGDESGMLPQSYKTEDVPRPEEAYGYMPFLESSVKEHLMGPGVARDKKQDFASPKFPQAFDAFADQPTGNIQDLRAMAIEQMMRRGSQAQEFVGPQQADPAEESLDDAVRRHIDDMQGDPKFEDYYRSRR